MAHVRLNPPPSERRRLYDIYQVAIGMDGSIIDEDDTVFLFDLGLETAEIDYPHGYNHLFRDVLVQDAPGGELSASRLINVSRGFVARRLIALVHRVRLFLRTRRLRRRLTYD